MLNYSLHQALLTTTLTIMAARIQAAFAKAHPAFVAYITGGFPGKADTVPILLAMQECGVDIIEVCLRPRCTNAHPMTLCVCPLRNEQLRVALAVPT